MGGKKKKAMTSMLKQGVSGEAGIVSDHLQYSHYVWNTDYQPLTQ